MSLSLQDKLLITQRLDELGFDYVEGGYPLSNEKDAEFFQKVRRAEPGHAKVCAFGMTRRRGDAPAEDPRHAGPLAARNARGHVVGKTWDFHVTEVLRVSLEENLDMIATASAWLVEHGPRGDLRRRAFLRRLQGEPRIRRENARPPRPPAGRRSSSPATPTAAACPRRSPTMRAWRKRSCAVARAGRHSHP